VSRQLSNQTTKEEIHAVWSIARDFGWQSWIWVLRSRRSRWRSRGLTTRLEPHADVSAGAANNGEAGSSLFVGSKVPASGASAVMCRWISLIVSESVRRCA
jgi:hypothetical protein